MTIQWEMFIGNLDGFRIFFEHLLE
jgi:hypothetical protein